MQRLRDLLDLFADNLLPTALVLTLLFLLSLVVWNHTKPIVTGISPQAAYTAETAGRIMEIHPRGRADVVCFVLHNPRKDAGDSISCVKENPVQIEKK
jgi:hypothetical protein